MGLALTSLAVAALVGLTLVFLGWRGRRIDDHPLCRRCGYDLIASETAVNCPECGRDLWLPRARRIGHRRTRWSVLALGLLLSLATLGGGGALGWAAAKGFDFNPYKPLWMLRREAVGSDAKRANLAQKEIFTRLGAGKLSKAQITSVVNQALAAQVDTHAAWSPWLGDFLEQAWQRKDIGDDIAMQYVRNAVNGAFAIRAPARVRLNNMMMITLLQHPMRAGYTGAFMVEVEQGPLTLDGESTLINGGSLSRSTVSAGSSGSSSTGTQAQFMPGKHHLSAQATVRVGPTAAGKSRTIYSSGFGSGHFPSFVDKDDDESWVTASWTMTLDADIEVVPVDAEIVEKVHDAAQAPAMQKATMVTRCRAMMLGPSGTAVDCRVEFDQAPVSGAFDVYVRASGKEWMVGTTSTEEGHDDLSGIHVSPFGRVGLIRDFPQDADLVDVVLRPNAEVAEQAGLARMWDGEIVIKDVTLERTGMGSGRGGGARGAGSGSAKSAGNRGG